MKAEGPHDSLHDWEGPSRVAVVVMAKDPEPGRTKTRLHGALSGDEAASLYASMLADRCDQVRALEGAVPALALAGWDGSGSPPALVPEDFVPVPQPPGDLGAGLAAAAAHFLAEGLPVVMVDSDSPTLPLAFLSEALDRLRGTPEVEASDLVMIPSEDGGYCLIGLRRPAPTLFEHMPWSTGEVVPRTLERAEALGLAVHLLPAWWDVDTPEDLRRLRQSLFSTWWPERTARWLAAREARSSRPAAAAVAEGERWRTPWVRLSSRPVYATPWLRVREDRALTPTGEVTRYSVIDTGECVGVLPFVDPETVLMVRQYRYVIDRTTWEMPTGGVHRGETPLEAAQRELAEEAHVRAARFEPIGSYHTSKSVMDETAHLFVAHDLTPTVAQGDDMEFIRIEAVPFSKVLAMVRSGEITDSMTIIAALRVQADG